MLRLALLLLLLASPAWGNYELIEARGSHAAGSLIQTVPRPCTNLKTLPSGSLTGLAIYEHAPADTTYANIVANGTLLRSLSNADRGATQVHAPTNTRLSLVADQIAQGYASVKLICFDPGDITALADLQEAQGAAEGQVLQYIGGQWQLAVADTPHYVAEIPVTTAAQLTGTLRSDVIYTVDGIIDMGSSYIEVPATGLTIRGFGFDVSQLISDSGSASGLFRSPVGGSGNLFVSFLTFDYSSQPGPAGNAKVFNLTDVDANQAVEMNDVNFSGTDEIGTLTNYRQVLMRNIGIFGTQNGLELVGPMAGGIRMETSIARGFAFLGGSGCIIRAGAGLVMSGRFVSDANIDLPAAACFTDIAPANIANDGAFQIGNALFLGAGTPLPNMPPTDPKARLTKNTGLADTYVGGNAVITAESATTPAGVDTLTAIAGTATYSDMAWFSSGPQSAFSYVYDSTETIDVSIHGHVSVTGTQGVTVDFIVRQWDDSAAGYVEIADSGRQTMDRGSGNNRAESVGFIGFATLEAGDRLELWLTSSSTNNITLNEDSSLTIEER